MADMLMLQCSEDGVTWVDNGTCGNMQQLTSLAAAWFLASWGIAIIRTFSSKRRSDWRFRIALGVLSLASIATSFFLCWVVIRRS